VIEISGKFFNILGYGIWLRSSSVF
jgi:hypothetical protein